MLFGFGKAFGWGGGRGRKIELLAILLLPIKTFDYFQHKNASLQTQPTRK